MIFVTIPNPNGAGYIVVNPFNPTHRAMLNVATTVTVRMFGADKAPVLIDAANRFNHFGYVFGYNVTVSPVSSAQEISITLANVLPGTAYHWAIIAARVAGRQEIKPEPLTVYTNRSEIRKQLVKQWCPSVVAGGSNLRNATADLLDGSQGFQDYIAPIFNAYGLYQHGSIPAPVEA